MCPPRDTVYLIDGSAQLHRAYFAIKGLATSRGLPTNAVYGFTTMLRKLYQDEEPEWVGISFDLAGAHLPPRAVQRSTRPTAGGWRTTSRCSSRTCAGSARSSACPIIDVAGLRGRRRHRHPGRAGGGAGHQGRGGLRRQGPAAARERRRAGPEPRPRRRGVDALRPQDGRGEVRRAAGARGGRPGPGGRRGRQRPRRARHRREGRARPGARVRRRWRRCSPTRTRSSAPPIARG